MKKIFFISIYLLCTIPSLCNSFDEAMESGDSLASRNGAIKLCYPIEISAEETIYIPKEEIELLLKRNISVPCEESFNQSTSMDEYSPLPSSSPYIESYLYKSNFDYHVVTAKEYISALNSEDNVYDKKIAKLYKGKENNPVVVNGENAIRYCISINSQNNKISYDSEGYFANEISEGALILAPSAANIKSDVIKKKMLHGERPDSNRTGYIVVYKYKKTTLNKTNE